MKKRKKVVSSAMNHLKKLNGFSWAQGKYFFKRLVVKYFLLQILYCFRIFRVFSKLYTPSTLNIGFIQWHTQLIVCAVKWITHDLIHDFHFTFQAYTLPHTLNGICVSLFKFHMCISLLTSRKEFPRLSKLSIGCLKIFLTARLARK